MNGSGIGVNRRSPLTQQGASKEVKVLRNGSIAVREGLVGRRDGRKGLIGTTAVVVVIRRCYNNNHQRVLICGVRVEGG